jgi:hypothetical protein
MAWREQGHESRPRRQNFLRDDLAHFAAIRRWAFFKSPIFDLLPIGLCSSLHLMLSFSQFRMLGREASCSSSFCQNPYGHFILGNSQEFPCLFSSNQGMWVVPITSKRPSGAGSLMQLPLRCRQAGSDQTSRILQLSKIQCSGRDLNPSRRSESPS